MTKNPALRVCVYSRARACVMINKNVDYTTLKNKYKILSKTVIIQNRYTDKRMCILCILHGLCYGIRVRVGIAWNFSAFIGGVRFFSLLNRFITRKMTCWSLERNNNIRSRLICTCARRTISHRQFNGFFSILICYLYIVDF